MSAKVKCIDALTMRLRTGKQTAKNVANSFYRQKRGITGVATNVKQKHRNMPLY